MTTAAAPAREWQLSLPLALYFAAFFAAPLAIMLAISLTSETDRSFVGLSYYFKFFADSLSRGSLAETLWLGAKTTMLCLLLGYPLAWLHGRASRRVQTLILFVIILPLLTSVVVRTFAWIVILGRQGIVNSALLQLGLIDAPLRLLYTEGAGVVALAQIYMPLLIYQQAISLNNWPFAATVSIVLLITVLALVTAFNQLGRASRGYASA